METKNTDYYENGIRHLLDELQRIDVMIRAQLVMYRQSHSDNANQAFNGLFIDDDQINSILEKKPAEQGETIPGSDMEDLRATCAQKVKNSLERNIYLPLIHLSAMFCLTSLELDILLVCLAPELNSDYETCYAYLQDDVTKKQPAVDFILNLLCRSDEEKVSARTCFAFQSPLIKYGLLQLHDDTHRKPLLSRDLKVDDRIVDFLLEHPVMDYRLDEFCRLIEPQRDWSTLILPRNIKEKLERLSKEYALENTNCPSVLHFSGPNGVGKKLTAEAFCYELHSPLIVVESRNLLKEGNSFEETIRLLYREALLHQAAIYFDQADALPGDRVEGHHYHNIIYKVIAEFPVLTFLAASVPCRHPNRSRISRVTHVRFTFPVPSYPLRKQMWQLYLDEENGVPILPQTDVEVLATKFRFTGGQIRGAVTDARTQARTRGNNGGSKMTIADLYQGCREQSNQNLGKKARKITPIYNWTDIVLPPDTFQQINEIALQVKHRRTVYSKWGFDRKLSTGKGLNALFYGPSGTGKTMAAEVIANDLGIDLYKIDLSCVVSKYIGETEKNLAAVFREAQTANAILFFDEADALFGKRSEVKDSHDRYANIEVGYLLQQMEEYEGIVILATNMRKNMDDAFVRRMQFIVEFPFPDENSRQRIWQGIFPPETPLDETVDFTFLMKNFKVSGGNIKNIALAAAFFAADDGQVVTMLHLAQACKREYQKMGKLCLKDDFGEYYEAIIG